MLLLVHQTVGGQISTKYERGYQRIKAHKVTDLAFLRRKLQISDRLAALRRKMPIKCLHRYI